MPTFFHRTRPAAARSILKHGFRDAVGHYLTDIELRGVFLSIDPELGAQEIPDGILLEIDLPINDADLAYYELVEEGKPYREWCVPAVLINARARVSPCQSRLKRKRG